MSEFQYITYQVEKGMALITINRPDVYGALNRDSKLELIQAIRQANRDEDVKCLLLASNGKAFCSGQDLNDRTINSEERAVDLGHTLETEWNPLVQSIRNSKKIIIGAIGGVCAGAGLSVALACDIIVSKPGVKFVSGFSKLGLAPDAGSSHTFARALGKQRTMEFFLFNKPLHSEEMLEAGLINHIDEDFMMVAKSMGQEISKMAPLSVEMIKSNILLAMDGSYNESMERETSTQRFLGNSKDYQEGLKAFFEKRSPEFKGQ